MKITKTYLKNLIREALDDEGPPEAAEPSMKADAEKVAKKMGATSGLGNLMQNINNRPELEDLLKQVIKSLSKKLPHQDIFRGLSNVLRDLKQELTSK